MKIGYVLRRENFIDTFPVYSFVIKSANGES